MKEYYFIVIIIIVIVAWVLFRLTTSRKGNVGYRCPRCHNEFSPSSEMDYLGPHIIFYKYIRCPKCQKLGWATVIRK
jgi:DNA-directed RNA polymerase subunit RPC12/RpoP